MKICINTTQFAMPSITKTRGVGKAVLDLNGLVEKWRKGQQLLLELKEGFIRAGIEVLDFSSPGFDPGTAEPADLIKASDAVVTLEEYPFKGFSDEGEELIAKLRKPSFIFVPHTADITRASFLTPLCVRSLFATPDFPSEVLRRFLGKK